jgi:competence protein ComEC
LIEFPMQSGKDLKDVFSRAGVLHILAVSGLHVGFVCLFVSSIILFIPLSHKIKFIIVMLVLLIYAGVTGFRPSICRATLMAFLFGLAIILQRNVDGIHIVNIVAIVFLIINPLLILDVGAQLSFAAIYGIIFLYPMIEKRLIRRVKNRYLRLALTAMAISFSAQAFVSPLLIYYFHRLPTLAVFSNLIIVPLASITIFLLFLSLMFSIFLIPLAKIIIFPISLLLNFLVSVSRFFADLSFSSVSLIISPVFLLVVYFLYPNKTRKLAIYLLLMAALVFSLSTFSNSVVIRISKDGTFITMPGGETVFVTSKNKTNLLFMYGLDKVDYLIAPKRFYPVKKDFFVLPEDLHFKEIKIGEMNIDLRKNLMLKYRDFIKNLSDDNFEKEGLIYMITDGKHVSQFETNLYKSIIDQITVDIRILYFKLKLML